MDEGNLPRLVERLGIRVSTEVSGLIIRRTEPHIASKTVIPKVAHFVSYKILQLIMMCDELFTLPHFKFPLGRPGGMSNHRCGRATKSICFESSDKDCQKYLWPS